MQAVILAAGLGMRLRPLTLKTPKPLLKVASKSILEHTMSMLPKEVDEVILVVGYLGHKIKKYFGEKYNGKSIKYVDQEKQLGTFHALKQAEPFLGKDFLILMADDLYSKEDLQKLLKFENSVLAHRTNQPSEKFGACIPKDKIWLEDLIEKQPGLKNVLANCGSYKLSSDIFKEKVIYGPTGEEWLSSMVGSLAKKKPVRIVEATSWFPIATAEDLKNADVHLKNSHII